MILVQEVGTFSGANVFIPFFQLFKHFLALSFYSSLTVFVPCLIGIQNDLLSVECNRTFLGFLKV